MFIFILGGHICVFVKCLSDTNVYDEWKAEESFNLTDTKEL